MKDSIKEELTQHIIDVLPDLEGTDLDDLHHQLFNTDYYIIGYWDAEQWLKRHDLSAFEAIDQVQTYEKDNFGKTNTDINSESIVNMLTYIYGEQILSEIDIWEYDGELTPEIIEELTEKLEEL